MGRAVALGLLGWLPAELDPEEAERQLAELLDGHVLRPEGLPALNFDPAADIAYAFGPLLPGHANGLVLSALDATGTVLFSETYYSIGGGFVVTATERDRPEAFTSADAPPWVLSRTLDRDTRRPIPPTGFTQPGC